MFGEANEKDEGRRMKAENILPASSVRQPATITVAHGVLFVIGVAAVIMRLTGLDATPLNSAEAIAALSAHNLWQPGAAGNDAVSPIYFALTTPLMPVFGSNDVVARLIPALFGIGLVLLPWLLHGRLGVIGALTASALLTVSPIFSIVSRSAGGDSAALFAGLLLLIALLRHADDNDENWLLVAGGALGLGLATTPLFFTLMLAWGAAWLVQKAVGLPLIAQRPEISRGMRRNAIITAVAVFLGITTILLWYPAGPGNAAAQFADWLSRFSFSAEFTTRLAPLLGLLRYQLGLIILGAVGIVFSALKRDRFGIFCTNWIIAGLLLLLLQNGAMSTVTIVVLPLVLVSGVLFKHWFAEPTGWEKWLVAVGVVLFGMLLLVNIGRFLRAYSYNTDVLPFIFILVFGVLLMAALLLLIINLSNDAYVLVQGILLGVLALLLFTGWGTAWWLTHEAANDVRERWVASTVATHDDMQRFERIVRDVSAEKTGAPTDMTVVSAIESPVLRWYLRNLRHVEFASGIPFTGDAEAVITSSEAEQPFEGDYLAMPFILSETNNAPTALPGLNQIVPVLRWWFFRDGVNSAEQQPIILWVKQQ